MEELTDTPAAPPPYKRKKRKRGRPKKNGRPRKYKDSPDRASPAKRRGARFRTLSVTEEIYLMLKELVKFYKHPSLNSYVETIVRPAFKQAYVESERLQRIDANRKKDTHEAPNDNAAPRRSHF